jgi:hypothetical protein
LIVCSNLNLRIGLPTRPPFLRANLHLMQRRENSLHTGAVSLRIWHQFVASASEPPTYRSGGVPLPPLRLSGLGPCASPGDSVVASLIANGIIVSLRRTTLAIFQTVSNGNFTKHRCQASRVIYHRRLPRPSRPVSASTGQNPCGDLNRARRAAEGARGVSRNWGEEDASVMTGLVVAGWGQLLTSR